MKRDAISQRCVYFTEKRLENIYLKSVCESLEEALINPRFVNALVEAVCISLRLSMDENIHKFYRIIKATDRELEYLRTSEIDPELWQGCIAAFGASKEEIDFWEEVCRKNGKNSTVGMMTILTETCWLKFWVLKEALPQKRLLRRIRNDY